MEYQESNQEGKQSESDDIQPCQEIKKEHDVHRQAGIEEGRQQLDSIRTQLDLERRRLEEERRQIELEKEKLSLKDSKSETPGSHAGSSGSLCVVCGEKATGMHYMAFTCEGCKIFFRRNAKKHSTLRCTNLDNQGQCDVVNKRRFCSACRFQKCLDAGMNMGRIWDTDRLKTRKPAKKLDPSPEPKVKTMKTKHHPSEQKPQEESLAPVQGVYGGCDAVSSSLGAPVTGASAGAGAGSRASDTAGAGSSGAASPQDWDFNEEFTDDHKLLIDSFCCAFRNSLSLRFDQSKGSFTELRKSHQMKNCSAQGTAASQQSAGQSAQPVGTDSSTASLNVPNSYAASWSDVNTGTQSSDTGGAAQVDMPTLDMASGESAPASVTMATKAAEKEDTPVDLSVPESVTSGGGGGLSPNNSEFEFDSDFSKLILEIILHELRQMIIFVKALPVYQKLPMNEQATFVKETFPDYIQIRGAKCYNPETNSFIVFKDSDPFEEVFLKDINHGLGSGASYVLDYGLNYCKNYAKMKFTEEEECLFFTLCILNPDRESFPDVIKQALAPHYTGLVEVLCASGRINHADEPLWFSQMMSQMAETRKISDMFKDSMMQVQLQGQAMIPLLGEVLDIDPSAAEQLMELLTLRGNFLNVKQHQVWFVYMS